MFPSRHRGGGRKPEEMGALRSGEGPACPWKRRTLPLSPAHCLLLSPAPQEGRGDFWGLAQRIPFFSCFLLRHVASDHDISVRCRQRLGLRRTSVYPGPSAKKRCGCSLLTSAVSLPFPRDSRQGTAPKPRWWGRAKQEAMLARLCPQLVCLAEAQLQPCPGRVRYRTSRDLPCSSETW